MIAAIGERARRRAGCVHGRVLRSKVASGRDRFSRSSSFAFLPDQMLLSVQREGVRYNGRGAGAGKDKEVAHGLPGVRRRDRIPVLQTGG